MPFLRAAVTAVVAALLLLALVGWGHLLPWHRERPQAMDGGEVDVQEAGVPAPPLDGEAGARPDRETATPLLPRVAWDPPRHGDEPRGEADAEEDEEDEEEERDEGPKPKRGKGWGRGWK
jgi:hypothetical protein